MARNQGELLGDVLMAKYQATYSFNVRRFIKHEIEAENHEEAITKAKQEAAQVIDDEVISFQNRDGFADAAPLDPFLYLDRMGDDASIEEEICSEPLTLPE